MAPSFFGSDVAVVVGTSAKDAVQIVSSEADLQVPPATSFAPAEIVVVVGYKALSVSFVVASPAWLVVVAAAAVA